MEQEIKESKKVVMDFSNKEYFKKLIAKIN